MNSFEVNPITMTPKTALSLSDRDKLLYFKRVRLNHPRIIETLNEVTTLATPESGKGLILLIGPTGVGKSTLVGALGERIVRYKQEEMKEDPGYIPVAMMVAPASGERGFSWKMFYLRLGEALNEPMMDKKLESKIEAGRSLAVLPGKGSTVTAMRVSVERVLQYRRTELIVIDEAVPLLRQARGNELANHMDALKTLADSGASLVLVGSYDLHQLAALSGQLARRTAIVHFRRYHTGVESDEMAFKNAIGKLQSYMPLKDMPDFMEMAGPLQEACLGCVGILKTTLATTLQCAISAGGKWSDSHLERSLLGAAQYETILAETLAGEAGVRGSVLGSSTFKSLSAMSKVVQARKVEVV